MQIFIKIRLPLNKGLANNELIRSTIQTEIWHCRNAKKKILPYFFTINIIRPVRKITIRERDDKTERMLLPDQDKGKVRRELGLKGLKRRKKRNTRTSALQLGEICSLIISFVFTIYSNGIVHILRTIDPLLPPTIFSACANFISPPPPSLFSLFTQKWKYAAHSH